MTPTAPSQASDCPFDVTTFPWTKQDWILNETRENGWKSVPRQAS